MKTWSSPNPQKDDPCDICVGLILGPHGLEGEVYVEPLSEFAARFAPGAALCPNQAGGGDRLVVTQARPQNRRLLLRFRGVDSLQQAQALRGTRLYVRRSELAQLPEGHFYEFQIVGLRLRTEAGRELGRITDIIHTGANDVYVTEQVLVPATHAAVSSIDLAAGEVVVRGEEWTVPTREQ